MTKEGEGMMAYIPTEDEIRREAYQIWKVRMKYKVPGTPEGDWIEAERKLQMGITEDVFSNGNRVKGYL